MTYDVIYTSYYLDNILYPGGTVQRTLSAADATNPRFDLIAVDATGPIVIPGTASASPEIPTVDPNTQLAITPALVGAGALTPTGVSNENIYTENSEWTPSTNNGTVNFNASANPFQGTKHIDCGAFTNGQYLKFVDNVTNQIADFGQIGVAINLKNTFSNSTKFSIRLYNGVTGVSSTVIVNSGTYNFDRTIVNAYQLIVIPISEFTFSSSAFDRLDIIMVGANATGFKLDNIILYKGSGSNSPEQNAITSIITDSGIANANTKDDTFQFKGANGLLVSAIGKIITFTQVIQDLTNFYTKAQIDSKLSSVYVFKGNVANYAALPSTGLTIGDVYNLTDTGENYAWTGTVWDNLGTTIDVSGKENTSNKTSTVAGNETSTSLYLNILGAVTYFQQKLTDSIFGTFINSLTAKTTPIDADSISIVDTGDGNKQKKVSLTNFKAFLKTYFDTQYKTDTQSFAISDLTTALATGDVHVGYAAYNFTITSFWIGAKTAPTISSLVVDVKKNGTSITSTKAGIDATELTSLTGTAPVLTTTSFTKGDLITANIYQVGSGETGRGLQLYLEIIKT